MIPRAHRLQCRPAKKIFHKEIITSTRETTVRVQLFVLYCFFQWFVCLFFHLDIVLGGGCVPFSARDIPL